MGNKQSTQPSPEIIIYNEPQIRFSHDLVNRLQKERLKKDAQTQGEGEGILPEEIERIVKYRVENELKKIQERQEEVQTRIKEEIERSRIFIEDSGANSVTTERDVKELVLRIERKYEDKILPDLIEQQRAVISCYKNNNTRTLDCWEQVQSFKRKTHDVIQEYVTNQK
ncbi:hypothetical protein Glove_122g73 [Diversispora epigaea]|uniref:Uncharacterized protein n=1 Tax=Diversispora epigaea TaxID=1348612 RepID=A0A397J3D8_9GLOM|nr:hypothetical protein Glove_122g73 [Diversispora epigaea]